MRDSALPDEISADGCEVWDLGGLPFAQLFQPADRWIVYSPEWRATTRNRNPSPTKARAF